MRNSTLHPPSPSITATATTIVHNNLSDPDGFYEALLHAHEGLTAEQSAAYNARLILILANQIGQMELLKNCLQMAQLSSEST